MYTGNVFGITFLILGFVISMVALVLLCAALAPDLTRRCSQSYDRPGRTSLVALLATFVAVVLVSLASAAVPALGAIVAGALAFAAMFGVAGLARTIGSRMPSPADEGRPWRADLRGAIVLHLAFAVPFVGWFGLLPLSLVAGLGALVRAVFAGRRERAAALDAALDAAPETLAEAAAG